MTTPLALVDSSELTAMFDRFSAPLNVDDAVENNPLVNPIVVLVEL